jgi:hypothetical protein
MRTPEYETNREGANHEGIFSDKLGARPLT